MALLGENGLAKDLGFPIDFSLSPFFFFFTPQFPIKISNLAALFLVKILEGGRRGGERDSESYLLPGSVSARMAVYRRGPS